MTASASQIQVKEHLSARGFGRMVALSLAIHLTAACLLAGGLVPPSRRDTSPVYYVDLLNLPVRDPQAGRPDARPPAEPAPAVRPEPPAAVPSKPPPAAKPEAKVAPKETPRPAAKAEPKTEDEYLSTASAIEQMRQRKATEDAIAAIRDKRQSAAPVEAPVGTQTGKGKSAGVDEQVWIQAYLKECWNLSKYQVTRRDLKAQAVILFNIEGQLMDYKIVQTSGDANFDDSVRRAILKAKQLPFRPVDPLEVRAEFNLKDLLD